MLQVLVEMDGIKNVAAIATILNKHVGDLVTTFATLYHQKLIFLVKPNPTIVSQSDLVENPSAKLNSIGLTRASVSSMQIKKDLSIHHHVSRKMNDNQILLSGNHNTIAESMSPTFSHNVRVDTKSPITKINQNTINSKDSKLVNTIPQKVNRTFHLPNSQLIDTHKVRDTRLPLRPIKGGVYGQKKAPLPKFDQFKECPTKEAMEYFEKGLAYLQRRSYKEALHQFQIALKLDPDNRLCRANIQRIKKVLQSNSYENFKKPQ
jgi:hypothetical protein